MTSEENNEEQGILEGLLSSVQRIKGTVEDILDELEQMENGQPFYRHHDAYHAGLDYGHSE
ncbi:unnamed protein product [marine sediment metagenome]|uniref:Uncharacterized protein n=1 Tax=marine sediment metagenome TaxID=412755 RepID=X0TW27_9ZZZZ